MFRFTRRTAKRTLIAGAALLAGGLLTFGGASDAEARGCRGYGGGYGGGFGGYGYAAPAYGYGGFYAPRPVVVARPVVVPARSYGSFYNGYHGHRHAFYGSRGFGVSIGF